MWKLCLFHPWVVQELKDVCSVPGEVLAGWQCREDIDACTFSWKTWVLRGCGARAKALINSGKQALGLSCEAHLGKSCEPVGFVSMTLNLRPACANPKGAICCLNPVCSLTYRVLSVWSGIFSHVSKLVTLSQKTSSTASLILGLWDPRMLDTHPACWASVPWFCCEQFCLQPSLTAVSRICLSGPSRQQQTPVLCTVNFLLLIWGENVAGRRWTLWLIWAQWRTRVNKLLHLCSATNIDLDKTVRNLSEPGFAFN